jgi:Zn-dependent M32 family carboxypeptidase
MGKWDSELNKVLKVSEQDAKAFEEWKAHYEQVLDAAQAFVGGYAKFAPKFAKTVATLMETAEQCGRAAAELSIYEDDYEEAKKNKDKDEMKKIEAKMKPLIETFDRGKEANRNAANEGNKEGDGMNSLLEALGGTI